MKLPFVADKNHCHLFYNLEDYLSSIVHNRFHKNGCIGAFDFFSIIIWKANRAKSKTANRIRSISKKKKLEQICRELTGSLWRAKDDEERLYLLLSKWKFKLPMATAILTVLYPNNFTVYDYRVEGQVADNLKLGTKVNFDSVWQGYSNFKKLVRQNGKGKTLREKTDTYSESRAWKI